MSISGIADSPGNSFRADQQFDALRQIRLVELPCLFRVREDDPSREETSGLLAQQTDIVMCRKGLGIQLTPRIGDDFERISPDTAR